MPNMTLALDDALYREVKAHPEIKWSEVARRAFRRQVEDMHALDAAFAASTLTADEVDALAREASEGLLGDLRGHLDD